LIRYGIDLSSLSSVRRDCYSKAFGVHARTLEIYEQLGLAQQAVEQAIARKRGCSKVAKYVPNSICRMA